MTLNSQLASIVPYNLAGVAQKTAYPVALHTPPAQGSPPLSLPVAFNWANYSSQVSLGDYLGVTVDLALWAGQQRGLDAIRSIKIDNSKCGMPIYVLFQDTGDVVQCGAYETVAAAVYTSGTKVTVFAEGYYALRSPQTVIQFCNFERQGFRTGPGTPDGPFLAGAPLGSTTSGANITLGINFGVAPQPDRLLGVAVLMVAGNGAPPNNMTLDGVAMSNLFTSAAFINPPTTADATQITVALLNVPAGSGAKNLFINTNGIVATAIAILPFVILNATIPLAKGPTTAGALSTIANGAPTQLAIGIPLIPPGALVFSVANYQVAANPLFPNIQSSNGVSTDTIGSINYASGATYAGSFQLAMHGPFAKYTNLSDFVTGNQLAAGWIT